MWRLWAKVLHVSARPFEAYGRLALRQSLTSFQFVSSASPDAGSLAMFWASNLFFLIFGLALSIPMLQIRSYAENPFLSFAFNYSFLSVFILLILMLNFSAWVTSTSDLDILLFRPLDSRSYMAARILVMLFFTLSWSLAFSLPLAARYAWAGGFHFALTLLLGSVLLTTLLVALVMAVLMAIVKRFGFRRLQLLLNFLQIAAAIVVGVLIIMQRDLILNGTRLNSVWVLITPAGWFASSVSFLMSMPLGPSMKALCVAASIVTTGILYFVLTRQSTGYAEALIEAGTGGEPLHTRRTLRFGGPARATGWFLPTRSQRAMFDLMLTYLRRDPKLRLSVLSLAVVFLFYLVYLFSGLTLDPNTNPVDTSVYAAVRDLERMLYYFATYFVLTLANYLIFHFRFSDHWQAAWLYHVAPTRPSELLLGALKAVTAMVVPFALAVDAVFLIRLSERLRMAGDLIILLLLLLIMEAAWMAIDPHFPLSLSSEQSRASLRTSVITFGIPLAAFAAWYFLRQVLDGSSILLFITETAVLGGGFAGLLRFVVGGRPSVPMDVEV